VNVHVEDQEASVPTLLIDHRVTETQVKRLNDARRTRDGRAVNEALGRLKEAAERGENVMPVLLDCARAYVTIGEMCDALRGVWGEYEEAHSI
jgi:methylmalonyl-CoA mutase N-terminal domain/subunit